MVIGKGVASISYKTMCIATVNEKVKKHMVVMLKNALQFENSINNIPAIGNPTEQFQEDNYMQF